MFVKYDYLDSNSLETSLSCFDPLPVMFFHLFHQHQLVCVNNKINLSETVAVNLI